MNIEIAPSGPAQFSIIRKSPEELLDEAVVSVTYKLQNWPVVYLLDKNRKIYVGENVNFLHRYRQLPRKSPSNDCQRLPRSTSQAYQGAVCLDLSNLSISHKAIF
ncbi:hypothetical protein AXFE_23070 [Acidithrix ferrooxidans]|uniref:GIY-YIG domain-containing protein n=1 Tax=Acidithrix ferrooxidans TaxID=1280514 RepID=A0A0D8HI99_9ACTN|nr:hypothetical protein AXFE_23070 [Acidithrix ferrooxidans]